MMISWKCSTVNSWRLDRTGMSRVDAWSSRDFSHDQPFFCRWRSVPCLWTCARDNSFHQHITVLFQALAGLWKTGFVVLYLVMHLFLCSYLLLYLQTFLNRAFLYMWYFQLTHYYQRSCWFVNSEKMTQDGWKTGKTFVGFRKNDRNVWAAETLVRNDENSG